ncbi:hypothetical protein JCM16358_19140 [Halanaerocella petrolearia]
MEEKLADVLEAEYKLYQKVYDLAEKKQEVVINEDIDQLEEIVKEEAEYLEMIQKLENNREQLVGSENISQLITESKEPISSRLSQLQENLLEITTKLQDLNQLNSKLITDALQLNNINLSILGANQQNSTYSKQGSVSQGQNGSSMLNQKA